MLLKAASGNCLHHLDAIKMDKFCVELNGFENWNCFQPPESASGGSQISVCINTLKPSSLHWRSDETLGSIAPHMTAKFAVCAPEVFDFDFPSPAPDRFRRVKEKSCLLAEGWHLRRPRGERGSTLTM
jgi:hypothetical protein